MFDLRGPCEKKSHGVKTGERGAHKLLYLFLSSSLDATS